MEEESGHCAASSGTRLNRVRVPPRKRKMVVLSMVEDVKKELGDIVEEEDELVLRNFAEEELKEQELKRRANGRELKVHMPLKDVEGVEDGGGKLEREKKEEEKAEEVGSKAAFANRHGKGGAARRVDRTARLTALNVRGSYVEEDVEDDVLEDCVEKVVEKRKKNHSYGQRLKKQVPQLNSKVNDGNASSTASAKLESEEENAYRPGTRKKPLKGDDALMCHQCQRNDKGRVVRCSSCGNKRFCLQCIKRWYPHLSENDFAAKCPVWHTNCNCKACLRMIGVHELKENKIEEADRAMPWLKELYCRG